MFICDNWLSNYIIFIFLAGIVLVLLVDEDVDGEAILMLADNDSVDQFKSCDFIKI